MTGELAADTDACEVSAPLNHRTVVVFVAPEPNHTPSQHAWSWARSNLIRPGDIVILVTCIPSFNSDLMTPAMGRPGSAAVSAEIDALEQHHKSILHNAELVLKSYRSKAKPDSWHLHTKILGQKSGSSIADTLVQWANRHAIEDVVVGKRKVGPFKGAMLALVGKGIVSKYVVNHANCPVVVVKDTN